MNEQDQNQLISSNEDIDMFREAFICDCTSLRHSFSLLYFLPDKKKKLNLVQN
jgi:hypothetical protein